MERLDEESRSTRAAVFAEMHAKVRNKVNKSQDYMAMELGVSKKTIQNWEKGISSPTFFQSLEWFRVLKVNPIPYYIQCVFPYRNVRGKKTDPDEVIEERFKMLTEQFSVNTKRALVYLFLGEHGSSPTAVVQFILEYLHMPMKDRALIAKMTSELYSMDSKMGNIVCPENILPITDLLDRSIESAKSSVLQNYTSYDPVENEEVSGSNMVGNDHDLSTPQK